MYMYIYIYKYIYIYIVFIITIKYISVSIYIHTYIYLKTLNGCIQSTTCAPPVSLNCFQAPAKTSTWKTTQRRADCVKGSPFLHI